MTSGFPGDFLYGGRTGGGGRPPMTAIGGGLYGFRQQQGIFSSTTDQIGERRADFLMGKRSLADFQSYQQQILLQQHQHQQQQQLQQSKPLSFIQQQYLMRSVKQRTDLSSTNNNSLSHDFNNFSSFSSPRFGVPVFQQLQPQSNHTTNNANGFIQKPGFSPVGFSNPDPSNQVDPDDNKILNTLQELEKQLLDDNDDDENDAVSVITNSEWSETFHNLMSPYPNPNLNPNPSPNPNSTSGTNMISPSPTSSTSSCCSSSPTASFSAKQLISEAATAISDGKIGLAMEVLGKLAQVANSGGNSEQRLAFYMAHALKCRSCPDENPPPTLELYGKDQMSAMYALYDLSPCFKFGLLTANLVMLEAITSAQHENSKIHVIDFDVGHGGQYVNLLRAIAERRAQELRVTVVETEMGNGGSFESVKGGLMKLAEGLGVNLRFEAVNRKIHELTREALSCEEGESLVVNFAFKLYRVPDESVSMENLRDELLRRVKGLKPRAVTLVEQDMNGNTSPFLTRVSEACGYYGALFGSLEVPRDHLDRVQVEEGLGRKMANLVACEGRERVERAEVFGKWRARMGMAGFELKPLSQSVAESMRAKLNSARGGNPGFTVKEESGGLGFGWMGRTLTVASAWR